MSEVKTKETKQLAEHFFRHEYAKMVSVITKYFGLQKVNMAEDVVQDTLMEAINTWEYRGIPENPTAWLYTVAKNKALNVLRREKYREEFENHSPKERFNDLLFSEEEIADDQLRMMFACCDPSISTEAQISLILKTLCGLSISEIARAFLTSNDTINKRLVRARRALRSDNISFEIPNPEILPNRLDTVLRTIYLLFNEGYSASQGDNLINYELCLEAIRLAELITSHHRFESLASPHALQALMLLNASRFNARIDEEGNFVRMVHQDRSKWNQQLIASGLQHLEKVKSSEDVGVYSIMATISAYHCISKDYESTNWSAILDMYDALIQFDNSPVVRLNRAIALSKVNGHEKAIAELLSFRSEIPESYHHFDSTLAELYMEIFDFNSAIDHLEKALEHAQMKSEQAILKKRINVCREKLK